MEIDVDLVMGHLRYDLRCFEERPRVRDPGGRLEAMRSMRREKEEMEMAKVVFHLLDRVEKLEAEVVNG